MEERRLHQRTQVQFEARVMNLTNPSVPALGRVSDVSEAGISVVLPLQFVAGDQVQLEMADSILTGRTVYCNPENSQFRIGIEVAQVQLGTSELSNLLQRTLLEGMPSTPGVELAETPIC
jgi:hypothetical protein